MNNRQYNSNRAAAAGGGEPTSYNDFTVPTYQPSLTGTSKGQQLTSQNINSNNHRSSGRLHKGAANVPNLMGRASATNTNDSDDLKHKTMLNKGTKYFEAPQM